MCVSSVGGAGVQVQVLIVGYLAAAVNGWFVCYFVACAVIGIHHNWCRAWRGQASGAFPVQHTSHTCLSSIHLSVLLHCCLYDLP